jgi:hypothetical protein
MHEMRHASAHAQVDQEDALGQLLVQLRLQQGRLLHIVVGAPAETTTATFQQRPAAAAQ